MATSYTLMLSQALLILAATQGCCGEDQGSLYLREATVVSSMKEVSQVMQCFADTTQEGLRLHKHNNDVLNSLPQMILHVKEEITKHNEDMNYVKGEMEALKQVIILTQEIMDLKLQLVNKDQKVATRDQEVANLKTQLDNKEQMVDKLSQQITELKNQIVEKNQTMDKLMQQNTDWKKQLDKNKETMEKLMQQITDWKKQLDKNNETVYTINENIVELKKMLADKNKTIVELEAKLEAKTNEGEKKSEKVEGQKPVGWTRECEQKQHLEKIKPVVQAFINSKDSGTMKTSLYYILDHSSVEFSQLQQSGSLGNIGYNGCTQLISLLLCAGLPVDIADSYKDTILHGAAAGGHMQLVKLLLDLGASVNVRGINNWTPLERAKNEHHTEVAQVLVQAAAVSQ